MTIYLEIDKTQSGNTLQTYTIHGKDGNTVVVTEVTGSGDQNLYNVTGPGCSVSQITATELFTMNYCN
jgi:hydroxyethylthiazole kinase-like sugar kinase family protein